jgi:lipid II:glycine glycyltransferase (peptidoglycan interpeptide bridge formation enzyme)
MLEVCTHQFLFFKRKEFWFYDSEKIDAGIYNVFCYSNKKDASIRRNVLIEQTSIINLEKTEEELFNQINRTFKYHIKKAEKLGVSVKTEFFPSIEKCNQIINEFSVFVEEKKIEWNLKRIEVLQKINKLIISEAYLNEKKISTHVYLHDGNRVVLLHSYHQHNRLDEKIKGYANKFLHWQDIISFKKFGLKLYDLGGINMEKHLGISIFKLAFGGDVIDCYSYIETNPSLNPFVNLYKKLKK